MGEDIDWPPVTVTMANNLGQVNDRESLARILQRLDTDDTGDAAGVIAVAVSAARAPDRGVQRTITRILGTSILTIGTQPWLVLMYRQEHIAQDKGQMNTAH